MLTQQEMQNNRTFTDPDSWENGTKILYPCNTQFMVYNPLIHRYFLTEAGLSHYGIDFSLYETTEVNNKAKALIEKTSKKVYDYIQYKSGRQCYQIMMYRIATAPTAIYPDQYYVRKMFEQALADQARWLVTNGDSAEFGRSTFAVDSGEVPPPTPEQELRDTSDMSKECIRTLESLGLLRWFRTNSIVPLDFNKF